MRTSRFLLSGLLLLSILLLANLAQAGMQTSGLTLSLEVGTAYTRSHVWGISNSAETKSLDLLRGDSATISYFVIITRDLGTESALRAQGTLNIRNSSTTATDIIQASALLSPSFTSSPAFDVVLTCPQHIPFSLAASQSVLCTFSQSVATKDQRTLVVQVSSSDGQVASTQKIVSFSDASVNLVAGLATIASENNDLLYFPAGGAIRYERDLRCDEHAGNVTSSATILESAQRALSHLEVRCRELDLSVRGEATSAPEYNWDFNARVDPETLALPLDTAWPLRYQIDIPRPTKGAAASGISGTLRLQNSSTYAVSVQSLSALLDDGSRVAAKCVLPQQVAPQAVITCPFTAGSSSSGVRAEAVLATQHFNRDGSIVSSASTVFTSAAAALSPASTTTKDVTPVSTAEIYLQTATGIQNLGQIDAETAAFPVRMVAIGSAPSSSTAEQAKLEATVSLRSGSTDLRKTLTTAVAYLASGCSHGLGYWKTHAGSGPGNEVVSTLLPLYLGTPQGTHSRYVATGSEALAVFDSAEEQDMLGRLRSRLLVAKLNVRLGTPTDKFASALASADLLLATHPTSATLSQEQQGEVRKITNDLLSAHTPMSDCERR